MTFSTQSSRDVSDQYDTAEPDGDPAAAGRARFEAKQQHLRNKSQQRQGWAESRQRDADERYEAAHRKLDAIPMGQPIHGSADRRYRERAWSGLSRSFESADMAKRHLERAESLGAEALHRESGPATQRRLERLEAERRDVARRLDGTSRNGMRYGEQATGEWRDRLLARAQELDEDIAYCQQHLVQLSASGAYRQWGKADFRPGDRVETRHGPGTVVRASVKTVRVRWDSRGNFEFAIRYADVRSATRDGVAL